MFLIGIGFSLFTLALVMYWVSWAFPIARLLFLDWIALFIMFVPFIIVLFRLRSTECWHQAGRIPRWKQLIKYLRRDNVEIELLGERAYPGESFLDIQSLGLVEFLGKDCFYSCGDKKIVWGLENLSFTPDPRYFNFTHLMSELGFKDSDDIRRVLHNQDPELMGKIYLNMKKYDNGHGVGRLISEMRDYDGDRVVFENKPSISNDKHDHIGGLVDKMKNVRFTSKPKQGR